MGQSALWMELLGIREICRVVAESELVARHDGLNRHARQSVFLPSFARGWDCAGTKKKSRTIYPFRNIVTHHICSRTNAWNIDW